MRHSTRAFAALSVATLSAAALTSGAVATTASAAQPARPSVASDLTHHHRRPPAPATIDVTAADLFPEAVGYDDRRHRFVVGSVTQGSLSTIALDGTLATLSDDPQLTGIAGMRVDARRDRALVANIAPDNSASGLASIDLETGATQWYVDLAAVAGDGLPHFTNDLTVAPDGTTYVIDAVSPVVYRVDRHGNASVLVRDPLLAPDGALPGFQPVFGSDAITWLPGDLLLVTQVDGTVLRIPVRHPERLREVAVTGLRTFVDSAMTLPGGRVGVVTHGWFDGSTSAVQTLRSDDGWRSARVTSTQELDAPFATGLTAGPGRTHYVLDGRLDLVFQGRSSDGFTLVRVSL